MPGDHPLVAEHRVQVARLVDPLARAPRAAAPARPRGRASRPSRRPRPRPRGISFAQARCLVPNSRRRSSRPSASRISTRERAVAKRGALVEHLQAARPTSGGRAARAGRGPVAPSRRRTRPRASCRSAARRRSRGPRARRAAGRRVFSATIPGASADSTSAPASAAPSRRAVISTSGSSGMSLSLGRRPARLDAVHSPGSRLAVRASRAGEHTRPDSRGDWSTAMRDLPTVQPTAAPELSPDGDRAALATRSARSPRSATPSSSPTTTSCPRSRTSPTTWATRSASRARRRPPTPT